MESNWSGRGQHAEYNRTEISELPLVAERLLGTSATARVDSVRCRRIRLARKTVQCNRRMTRKDVMKEVEHLQRIHHRPIVRLIGTYTTSSRDLSVLLYPVAEYNLEQFLATADDPYDDYIIHGVHTHVEGAGILCKRIALQNIFGCLADAVRYIHTRAIKHMDIKPKNILIRAAGYYCLPETPLYTVFLADFGIARSYASVAHADTEGPTSFTRKYAAPEVVVQARRGLSADIFSLGCVFVEVCVALSSNVDHNAPESALDANEAGDGSYSANIPANVTLLDGMSFCASNDGQQSGLVVQMDRLKPTLSEMLSSDPDDRPSIHYVSQYTGPCKCRGSSWQPQLEVARDLNRPMIKARHLTFLALQGVEAQLSTTERLDWVRKQLAPFDETSATIPKT